VEEEFAISNKLPDGYSSLLMGTLLSWLNNRLPLAGQIIGMKMSKRVDFLG